MQRTKLVFFAFLIALLIVFPIEPSTGQLALTLALIFVCASSGLKRISRLPQRLNPKRMFL